MDAKPVYRLGSDKPVTVDVRFLAATNQDLETEVQENRFRPDLFYRLNVVRIQTVPLRERKEDIPKLLDHYIAHFNNTFQIKMEGFTREAMESLVAYSWPGNVRELRNVVEVASVSVPHGQIGLLDLPVGVRQHCSHMSEGKPCERDRLLSALIANNWNKTQVAGKLRWSRMTLYRKMSHYNLVRSPGAAPALGSTTAAPIRMVPQA
jgi:DNA-binding NtrC family response regulator